MPPVWDASLPFTQVGESLYRSGAEVCRCQALPSRAAQTLSPALLGFLCPRAARPADLRPIWGLAVPALLFGGCSWVGLGLTSFGGSQMTQLGAEPRGRSGRTWRISRNLPGCLGFWAEALTLSVFPCRPMSPHLFLFRICPSLIPALAYYWVQTSPVLGLLPLLIRPQVCTEMCLILPILHDFPRTLEMGNGDSIPSPLVSSHTPLLPLPALPSTCCETLSKSLHYLSFQVNCQVPAILPPTPRPPSSLAWMPP